MSIIALIGDSIFDNAPYVKKGREVIEHMGRQMPDGWAADLLATDGDIVEDVAGQLENVADDVTHLFVSIGGNNALGKIDILTREVEHAGEVFYELSEIAADFEAKYQSMLESLLSFDLPTTLCTVYYPRYKNEIVQKLSVAALATFNDVIIRQAFLAGVPLIDLRLLCNEDTDYANPIEPSDAGGLKIVNTIIRIASEHDFSKKGTAVYF